MENLKILRQVSCLSDRPRLKIWRVVIIVFLCFNARLFLNIPGKGILKLDMERLFHDSSLVRGK